MAREYNLRSKPKTTAQENRLRQRREKEVPKEKPKARSSPRSRPVDIVAKVFDKGSDQAKLWALNATESPLLRLPAELRLAIYELVLGGPNTILITHNTEGKYTSRVWGPSNPFRLEISRPGGYGPAYIDVSDVQKGFTLLNGVCRQLYHETAVLPYQLNIWMKSRPFIHSPAYGMLEAYTMAEKRLPLPQRRAINVLLHMDYFIDMPSTTPRMSSMRHFPASNRSLLKHLGGVRYFIRSNEYYPDARRNALGRGFRINKVAYGKRGHREIVVGLKDRSYGDCLNDCTTWISSCNALEKRGTEKMRHSKDKAFER
ncbi:hypothetical protein EJ04DRAFT_565716 [Polyplosphaeria fusca]|uniref:Uncharacterized protein n=1 Tax=Polyplosphaeria fusca TaxID=682080 RepID=A0A9P4QX67_9PLEO|nr:hypothetical protein EJ04DRAFT_565716 [Polyplosphaeria fusca]